MLKTLTVLVGLLILVTLLIFCGDKEKTTLYSHNQVTTINSIEGVKYTKDNYEILIVSKNDVVSFTLNIKNHNTIIVLQTIKSGNVYHVGKVNGKKIPFKASVIWIRENKTILLQFPEHQTLIKYE